MLESKSDRIFAEVIPCNACEYYRPASPSGGNCFYTTVIQRPEDYCSRAKEKSEIVKG